MIEDKRKNRKKKMYFKQLDVRLGMKVITENEKESFVGDHDKL
jgi:hypothetical protein